VGIVYVNPLTGATTTTPTTGTSTGSTSGSTTTSPTSSFTVPVPIPGGSLLWVDPVTGESFTEYPGYATGGYTGPGARNQPAGIVHAGEVVWSQADVARWGGWQSVDALRTSPPPVMQPSAQSSGMTSARLEALVEKLSEEVAMLRCEARATAVNTAKTTRMLDDVTQGGTALRTTEVAA
jgi:hypothetical protein